MNRTSILLLLIALTTAVLAPFPLAAAKPRHQQLTPGQDIQGVLYTDNENGWYRTYVFDLPVTAVGLRIRLPEAAADLDLFLKYGENMEDHSSADFYSESADWQEEMILLKAYETYLPAGRYYLDIVYQLDETPRSDGLVSSTIPYTLSLEFFDGHETQTLVPEEVSNGVLDESGGYMTLYELDVAEDTEAFRIDVLDCDGDVDLFLSRGDPAPTRDGFHTISESMAGRESILVEDRQNDLSGKWYLTILEAVELEYPVVYSLVYTPGAEVPESAPAPPDIQKTEDRMGAGRQATVQLIGGGGIGSGCLLGIDGYILTNHHVTLDESGTVLDEMLVAVSTDPFRTPVEAYTARIVETIPEDDLALLKITGDRWGRPLPESVSFQGWRLGDPLGVRVGEPLLILGYPWVGSGMSRPFFTVTRGILAGGERTPRGLVLKTDAVISGGSSGGAVTDGSWRLLGLPTFVVSDEAAQMTYFVPVDRIPRDWRDLIRYE